MERGVKVPNGTLISSLFPKEVLCAEAIPEIHRAEMFEEEWNCVAKAVPKRQAEFSTVRICARKLLSQLGFHNFPLLPNKDRSPRWPSSIVGSISHTNGYCAVVAARSTSIIGLGLDVEQDDPIKPELVRLICTDREHQWLSTLPVNEQLRIAKLIFCAKESAYKCQYPLSKVYVDFRQAEIDVDLSAKRFQVMFTKDLGPHLPKNLCVSGQFKWSCSMVLSSATLYREEID